MSAKWILDCSTSADALQSVSALLSTTPSVLREKWRTFSPDDPCYESVALENRLLLHLGYEPNRLPNPSAIRWFHATRALPGTDFQDGILPTMQALPRLWEAFGTVIERRRWISRLNGSDSATRFGNRALAEHGSSATSP